MKLGDLLKGVQILETNAELSEEISGVRWDSRQVKPGELFVAMAGYETDGHKYIPMAREKGAKCVLCQEKPEDSGLFVRVEDSRAALAWLGINWYGDPSAAMTLVGVTGTNGKTTTTYLLKCVLEKCLGAKVGLIGTNQNMAGNEVLPTERTTPESFELQGLFRYMADKGCSHVVMEVSSHALTLKRVEGVQFAVGIFTNLTQDHLDFHGTMENYCDAKAKLFRMCGTGVYNAGDAWSGRLLRDADCKKISYGGTDGDLRAENIGLHAQGVEFDAVGYGERVHVQTRIPGGFTVSNALGVLAAAKALGIPLSESAKALADCPGVKGRVEVVPVPYDYTVLIDYAHTPDALKNVLKAVRGITKGRVMVLFGCGGDRDRTKRPKMGRIAVELADYVYVTSDNPRTEDPAAIISDILEGMTRTKTPYSVEPDRVKAIYQAMDGARTGDVLILAGKGHETYQVVGHEKRHMDEREIVAGYVEQREKAR